MRMLLFRNALACVLCTCLVFDPGWAGEYETPPVLLAAETVTDFPLETDIYRIAPDVPTDGFMARYRIQSDYGDFEAFGPGMLDTRLNEIRALAVLSQMQQDDRFKKAADGQARETFDSLKRLVENPKESLEGIPEGVGRFFKRTDRTVRTGLQKLSDVRQGHAPGVDPGTGTNLPGADLEARDTSASSFTETVARAGGEAAVNILGFDKQRRLLAQELGVDPYTTNPVLAEKLDEVTWAAFAGGLGVNVLKSLVPGGMILSTSSQLSNWVWDKAPGDLRVEIESTLLSIGVAQEDTDRFLRHSYYPLSMQAVVAASLDAMEGVKGRETALNLALSVGSVGQARFVAQSLDMLRNHHLQRAPVSEIEVAGTLLGVTRAGGLVIMAPVDHLCWTPGLEAFVTDIEARFDPAPLLSVDGTVSDRARLELTALGWTVEERSPMRALSYPVR